MAPPALEGVNHLLEELLSNILIRLPSKFVVRCKLVCKRWASLISDPFFVSSYVSRFPPSSSTSWTFVGELVKDRCIEYDLPRHIRSRQDLDTLCRLSIGRECKQHESFRVLGASDGLILFGLIDEYRSRSFSYVSCSLYYICNPTVRKLISLTPPPESLAAERLRGGSGLVARVGPDEALESFRVVLLLPDERTDRLRFRVYASETQEWNDYFVPRTDHTRRRLLANRPVALNRILHWVSEDGSIIAYDPYNTDAGRVRVIAPPKDECRLLPRFDYSCLLCGGASSEGKLRYFERAVADVGGTAFRYKLWVLEDYGSGVWAAQPHESADYASVRFDGGVVSHWRLSKSIPMFFDPFDSDIVYLREWDRYGVISYDVRTREVEAVHDSSISGRTKNEMFPWYLAFLVEFLP